MLLSTKKAIFILRTKSRLTFIEVTLVLLFYSTSVGRMERMSARARAHTQWRFKLVWLFVFAFAIHSLIFLPSLRIPAHIIRTHSITLIQFNRIETNAERFFSLLIFVSFLFFASSLFSWPSSVPLSVILLQCGEWDRKDDNNINKRY